MKLRDIASAAGTSLTTVSLVLNDKPGVSPEKREQIRQMLRDNGYEIRTSKTIDNGEGKTICFLKYSNHSHLVNGNPGFVTQILDAVEKECRRRGYTLTVVSFDDFSDIDLGEVLTRAGTRGAILLGTEMNQKDMEYFQGLDVPLVVVDNALPLLRCNSVTMDNYLSIFLVVEHLVQLGHRQIGFLYNSLPSGNDRARFKAFQEALEYYNVAFDPELVYSVFPTMDGAMDSVTELLRKGTRFPAALVGNNDAIAFGAMRAFQSVGLFIPEDISITGFDGLPISAMAQPPLTTVEVSCAEIGTRAVLLLHDLIRGRCTASIKTCVETNLIIRGSTAASHPSRSHPSLLPNHVNGIPL